MLEIGVFTGLMPGVTTTHPGVLGVIKLGILGVRGGETGHTMVVPPGIRPFARRHPLPLFTCLTTTTTKCKSLRAATVARNTLDG